METIGAGHLVFCALVVTGAFAVRGVAGFGGAAVAVPLTALVLPVQVVIPVVANLQLVATLDHSARNWRIVAWRELLRIAPFMIAGVLIGLYLFSQLDGREIGRALGVFVMGYAIFAVMSASSQTDVPRRLPWPVAATLNTIGSLIGALFGGAAAPFYAVYFKALCLPRDAFRATMTAIVLAQVVLRIGGYAKFGLFPMHVLIITGAALPFMLLGAKLGEAVAGHVDQCTFNRILSAVLFLSGAVLVCK